MQTNFDSTSAIFKTLYLALIVTPIYILGGGGGRGGGGGGERFGLWGDISGLTNDHTFTKIIAWHKLSDYCIQNVSIIALT